MPNAALLETIRANKDQPERRQDNIEQEMPREQQEEKPHNNQGSSITQDETPGLDLAKIQNRGDNGVNNEDGTGEEDEEDWETDNGQDSGEDDEQIWEADASESALKACSGSKGKDEMSKPDEDDIFMPDEDDGSRQVPSPEIKLRDIVLS